MSYLRFHCLAVVAQLLVVVEFALASTATNLKPLVY